MARDYGKAGVSAPRANPRGTPPRGSRAFPKPANPNNVMPLSGSVAGASPGKKSYSKANLQDNPLQFSGAGFGGTGLAESPSIVGMGKNGTGL